MKNLPLLLKTLLASIVIAGLSQQQIAKSQSNNQKLQFVQPVQQQKPVNRGAPTDRRGAGTRGECPQVSIAPTSLVPLEQINNSPVVKGNTATEYPTFWFYIPYNANNIHSVKFALIDGNEKSVTKEPIPVNLSGTPGIISFTLPKTGQPLRAGENYHWYLLIDCNPQSDAEDLALDGLVRFVPPDVELEKQLKTANQRDKAMLYAQKSYWHDAITIVGQLRRQKNDGSSVEDWKSLLGSVDLSDVAAEPISPCCK